MKIETQAVHAGHQVDPGTGAVTPTLVMSTTFERSEDGSFPHSYIYTRSDNPNRVALETCLATLENGTAAAAFASGSAATAAVLHALRPGDHVIAPDDLYYGTARIFCDLYAHWSLETSFVDMRDPQAVERAMRPNTRLVWIETPSNPRLHVSDISKIAEIAHAGDALCVCDNTWATPVLQRPLELSADLVVHSTTKYMGGHSDVLGGAVITKTDDDMWQRIRAAQSVGGGVPSPFDCWLLLRSVATLPLRMDAHCRNARIVAQFLHEHSRVEQVYYPGLASDGGHAVAVRQMRDWGGMVSCNIRGGRDAAMAIAAKLKLFTRATSLGGVESLIEHRASIEGPDTRAPEGLLRISVGIEHPDDLIADLEQALG
jgi:cystathionine gamma-synthase